MAFFNLGFNRAITSSAQKIKKQKWVLAIPLSWYQRLTLAEKKGPAAKLSDLQSQKFEKSILNCACSEIGLGYDERVIGFSNF